jgi:hypothetical protein
LLRPGITQSSCLVMRLKGATGIPNQVQAVKFARRTAMLLERKALREFAKINTANLSNENGAEDLNDRIVPLSVRFGFGSRMALSYLKPNCNVRS